MNTLDTALVVGVGLIGGSLAGALKAAGVAKQVVGLDADAAAAATALQLGLVDSVIDTLDTLDALPAQVDLALVCTSSEQIAAQVAALAPKATLVMDVGSVKAPIITALEQDFGGVPPNFIPCHPISGSEQSGPAAAQADLFQGAVTVISSPHPEGDADDLIAAAAQIWEAAGAQVLYLSPAAHDEMLAVTSHLPHLLAFAYMQQVDEGLLPYTGGGFRDFTRIAAANPQLWWRILSMNRKQVVAAAEVFNQHLQILTQALAADDAEAGLAALQAAADLRQKL